MKTIRNTIIQTISIITLFLFTMCSEVNETIENEIENSKKTENVFLLKLSVIANKKDITTTGVLSDVSLFIFNSNNKFIKRIEVEKNTLLNKKEIKISHSEEGHITVIAWGGLKNVEVSTMNTSNTIEDLVISLIENNGIANPPGDIFYGKTTLARNQEKENITVMSLKRKASALDLLATTIPENLISQESNYHFLIKYTQSAYNYNGELTGKEVQYIIPGYINKKGDITISKSSIFPTLKLDISLYKDSKLICTNSKEEEDIIVIEAGDQLGCFFDYMENLFVTHIASWDTIIHFL